MSFGSKVPPVKQPDPPPSPPTSANASTSGAVAQDGASAVRSLVNTTGSGLARKANTSKRSLIGGA